MSDRGRLTDHCRPRDLRDRDARRSDFAPTPALQSKPDAGSARRSRIRSCPDGSVRATTGAWRRSPASRRSRRSAAVTVPALSSAAAPLFIWWRVGARRASVDSPAPFGAALRQRAVAINPTQPAPAVGAAGAAPTKDRDALRASRSACRRPRRFSARGRIGHRTRSPAHFSRCPRRSPAGDVDPSSRGRADKDGEPDLGSVRTTLVARWSPWRRIGLGRRRPLSA